jgi:gliding motility-associated-like protein
MKSKSFFVALSLLFSNLIFGQLVVTTTSAASTLAQAIAGNGVTVSNAALNCGPSGAGTFSYTGANLGIANGILLTTGVATDPANPGTYWCSVSNGNIYTDPDLTSIEPSATNDVCILEFDFVPMCNSLSVTFVFGSEEYPTFVGSFNDAFGIFITGPNPGGGTYSAVNMGTLPNGTPVSINNVNATTNSAYFVDNYTSPNSTIAFDGYTIPVTATKAVVPCSTYHLKIGIADAGDEMYDSGVFVGGNAVTCQTAPTVTASATSANCSGNNGTATATVTNYTGTVTYAWSPGGATTPSINGLSPGTYTCVVGLQLGCGNITQTVTATVASTGSSLSLTTSTVNPSCANGTNGSATANPVGGTSPYTYTWNTTPVQTTATATNLPAGTYMVTVKDNAGCQQTASVTLTNPAAMQTSTSTTPASCTTANGTATANVLSGGTGPFTYAWGTTPVQNAQTATGLSAGTYSVLITDFNGCTVVTSAVVSQQSGGWTVTANTPTNVSCYGGSDGAAGVTINNPGSNVFTYTWSPGNQSAQNASNLSAGNYTCNVADALGCTQTTTVSITQSTQMGAGAFTITKSKCGSPTGAISLSGMVGGTPPYSYSWNTNPVQTTQNLSGMLPGTYVLTVTDANNCMATYTQTIGIIPGLPLFINTSPERCHQGNGTAIVTANGTPPYTYSWNTNPVQTSQQATGLQSGSYIATVTDFYGCKDSIAVTIKDIDDVLSTSFYITPPDEIDAEDPVVITITTNQGWTLDTAFLSDGNIPITESVSHVFHQYGLYYASYWFTSVNDCRDSVIYPIKVNDYMTLYIPNAFSPNGDGLNDNFMATGTFIQAFDMSIFDRWGHLVIHLTDITKSWDGTYHGADAPEDTYVYKGTATDIFSKKVTFQGQIQLVK